jgi:hypothetical protein
MLLDIVKPRKFLNLLGTCAAPSSLVGQEYQSARNLHCKAVKIMQKFKAELSPAAMPGPH